MSLIILYLATAAAFFVIDMIGLRLIVLPVFHGQAPGLFMDNPRLLPAALFYLAYVAGILFFVSLPALKSGSSLGAVFLTGAILGALCYGTYEITNFATLKEWTVRMVATDLTWGAILTGISAMAGVAAVRAIG